jgi:hypothetical protein
VLLDIMHNCFFLHITHPKELVFVDFRFKYRYRFRVRLLVNYGNMVSQKLVEVAEACTDLSGQLIDYGIESSLWSVKARRSK